MPGLKRSWKLTAATRPRSPQQARIRFAPARSGPIGFCISTADAARQLLEDADDLIAGDGDVEDRAGPRAAASTQSRDTTVPMANSRAVARACSGSMSNDARDGVGRGAR